MDADMEIVEWREVQRSSWGRKYFDHTKFICQRQGVQDDFYYGVSKHRSADARANPQLVRDMTLQKIPRESIFPKWEEGLSVVPEPLPLNVYLKSPKLIDYGDAGPSSLISTRFLHEARMCEVVKANPHPNVAQYHGCIVEDGLIKALCFARYPLNLLQRGEESIPINTDHCYKYVGKGAKHLHSLGLVHNNIHPSNVMMDGDVPILIDFAAARKIGESLIGHPAGAPPWLPANATTSVQYNDYYATRQIYHWLRER